MSVAFDVEVPDLKMNSNAMLSENGNQKWRELAILGSYEQEHCNWVKIFCMQEQNK